jgi:hypothetical protein
MRAFIDGASRPEDGAPNQGIKKSLLTPQQRSIARRARRRMLADWWRRCAA